MRTFSIIGQVSKLALALVAALSLQGCISMPGGGEYSLYQSRPDDSNQHALIPNFSQWGKDKAREDSVAQAKIATSDPVGASVVLQDKKMYWGPSFGNTYFSAKLYAERQELVNKRPETPITERAALNDQIVKKSDEIVANERMQFVAKISSLKAARVNTEQDREELAKQVTWCEARLADLDHVPARLDTDSFDVAALAASAKKPEQKDAKEAGGASVAQKQ
jgi:hypothetical protein